MRLFLIEKKEGKSNTGMTAKAEVFPLTLI